MSSQNVTASPFIFGFSRHFLNRSFCCKTQGSSQECLGQQSINPELPHSARTPAICHPYYCPRSIFSQKLPAGPTRHRTARAGRRNGNGDELPLSLTERLEQSDSLRTAGEPKTGALHVRS